MSEQLPLDLFGDGPPPLPEGMRYQPDFLSAQEEAVLLEHLSRLEFRRMVYKEYEALRRVVSFASRYDFSAGRLEASEPMPHWLEPLCSAAARWAGLPPADFTQALAAEYPPGTPLGWHRDVPDFEHIVGVSLLGEAVMRFRPFPHQPGRRGDLRLPLAPRSIYLLSGPARWGLQHSVMPTETLRYSITLRTARHANDAPPA